MEKIKQIFVILVVVVVTFLVSTVAVVTVAVGFACEWINQIYKKRQKRLF